MPSVLAPLLTWYEFAELLENLLCFVLNLFFFYLDDIIWWCQSIQVNFRVFQFILKVKSRMMGDPSYKSTLDCFIKTLKNDVSVLLTDFTKLLEEKLLKKKRAEVYAIHGFFRRIGTGTFGFLQGIYPEFWPPGIMERYHVLDSGAGTISLPRSSLLFLSPYKGQRVIVMDRIPGQEVLRQRGT